MEVRVDGWAWLPKSELTFAQLHMLRQTLTVYPRNLGPQKDAEVKPVYLFQETDSHMGVAREYFYANRRAHHQVDLRTTLGDATRHQTSGAFSGLLRDEQRMAVSTVMERFHSGTLGGIVRAPAGSGKTVLACALIAQLDLPTLVIVHKEFLMNQWKERIAEYLPEASVGHAQQDVCDYEGRSIVLGMIHSLGAGKYPQAFHDWVGFVVVDECHRLGAATFSAVPPMFRAKHRLGLSATPRRKDGAENAFFWHLGPVLFSGKEQRLLFKVKRVWTKFKLVKTDRFNPTLAPRSLVITFLTKSTFRNRVITEQMISALQAGRKLIVLSERLDHLSLLATYLHEMWPDNSGPVPTVGFYVGGKKEHELAEAREARVLLATTQFATEGLDIPELDTLFLTTPISDVEQAVGRILRPHEAKKEPVVVDFRDDGVSLLERQAKSRDRYYEKFV